MLFSCHSIAISRSTFRHLFGAPKYRRRANTVQRGDCCLCAPRPAPPVGRPHLAGRTSPATPATGIRTTTALQSRPDIRLVKSSAPPDALHPACVGLLRDEQYLPRHRAMVSAGRASPAANSEPLLMGDEADHAGRGRLAAGTPPARLHMDVRCLPSPGKGDRVRYPDTTRFAAYTWPGAPGRPHLAGRTWPAAPGRPHVAGGGNGGVDRNRTMT